MSTNIDETPVTWIECEVTSTEYVWQLPSGLVLVVSKIDGAWWGHCYPEPLPMTIDYGEAIEYIGQFETPEAAKNAIVERVIKLMRDDLAVLDPAENHLHAIAEAAKAVVGTARPILSTIDTAVDGDFFAILHDAVDAYCDEDEPRVAEPFGGDVQ